MGRTMTGSGKPSNKATRHSPGNKRRNGQGLPPRKRFLHVRGSRKGKAGPRYPSILLKELKALPGNGKPEDDQDPGISTADVYEYEEGVPEEESGKNRRFDDVDRLEYELPSDFEDEEIPEDTDEDEEEAEAEEDSVPERKERRGAVNVDSEGGTEEEEGEASDEDADDGLENGLASVVADDDSEDGTDDAEDDDDADDEERHLKMISDVTGDASSYLFGKKKRKREPEITEAYEESEYNVNPSSVPGSRPITVDDLMSTLRDKPRFGALRKRMEELEKRSIPLQPSLRKPIQDRVERHAGYENTKEDITKWQSLVKANRESSCLVFNKKPEITAPSTASLAAKFQPQSDMEKDIASLLRESGLADGSTVQEAETLALNKLSVEEVKERQQKLARMRSLLFQHEVQAKRIKKIKSKTYHRLLQKSQKRKAESDATVDPEAAKDVALKQEFKRAQERMTLKHKNTSRWAKRILKRGLQAHANDGVREAIAEQLQAHNALTRKIHSANMSSSDDESSEEEGDGDSPLVDPASGLSSRTKLLTKAKAATLSALEGDAEAEIPTTGLFALPFMTRAIEKKRKEAQDTAAALLKQLEAAEDDDAALEDERDETARESSKSGKLVFGSSRASSKHQRKGDQNDRLQCNGGSGSEAGSESDEERGASPSTTAGTNRQEAREEVNLAEKPDGWDLHHAGLVHLDDRHKTQATGVISVDCTSSKRSSEVARHNNGDCEVLAVGRAHGRLFSTNEARDNGLGTMAKGSAKLSKTPKSSELLPSESPQVSFASSQRQRFGKKRLQSSQTLCSDNGSQGEAIPTDKEGGGEIAVMGEDVEDTDDHHTSTTSRPLTQEELIRRAFAGDDVEKEFEEAKASAVEEELPPAEGTVTLPGWGQWTDVQQKKGPPAWILKEQARLLARKEAAMKNRKDYKLKHIVISEKMDKKAKKFTTQALPFPFTSKEAYERSMRMPIGRDFNTDKAFRNMIQRKEVRSAGIAIEPIKHVEH